MMVMSWWSMVQVKMPECIDEMVDTYRFENYEKYYYYASNPQAL